MPSSDRSAASIAARQFGVVTRAQALAAGLTRNQIASRVKGGRWRVAARGVYVVSGAPASWLQATLVACLAGPPGTLASHTSAAALYGLCRPPAEPHVSVPLSASGRFRGATVHRTRFETLIPCRAQGIPVTHPARTILDCASVVGLDALCDLVDDAFCRKLTSPGAVREAAFQAGRSGRRGVAALAQALEV
jgi:predicted transcriptional regulator of viral defense system